MTHELLANIWYYTLGLVWVIYLSQELFVTGVSMLSLGYRVEDAHFQKLNETVATFWDGIQVWLIVAIGGLFATFPMAFGLTFQALYTPIFLLLMTIILRGVSIELIYKSDDPLWQKGLSKVWGYSSFALLVVEGIYLTNIFIGLPIKEHLMVESFTVVFSRAALFGSALLVLSALSMGYAWIKLTLGDTFPVPKKISQLWISGSVVFVVTLYFLSLTNKYQLFETGPFVTKPLLWIMPIGAILSYLLQFVCHLKEKYAGVFIATVLGLALVVFSGFTASFPYILGSTISASEGILIVEAAASRHALILISGVALVFLPVVIGYQGWKYKKYWRNF